MTLPADAIAYYNQIEREVIDEVYHQDPVLSEIKLKRFVSSSKSHDRKRRSLKEVILVKYGHEYHQPHRFNWWVAGIELIGMVDDVETKLMEIVLGNLAFDMNSLKMRVK